MTDKRVDLGGGLFIPNIWANPQAPKCYHTVGAEEELKDIKPVPKCSKGCIPLNCKSPDNCEFDKLDK